MINLYTFPTPNGRKPVIMLEELGLPYSIHKVDITKGEQFRREFVAINPNSKIPALVDQESGIQIFESGAILMYLAQKSNQLLPTETTARFTVIEWLMFQMANVGPMLGQLSHFRKFATKEIPYAINRYEQETLRLFDVLDKQLAKQEFIAGDYSIADIATYPWVAAYKYLQVKLDDYVNLQRWVKTLQKRPAVRRGMTFK